MHFEKLRLSGFKSFVDQTEMLMRPGVTGVIGPNGCGKSNLLEALRWVMGETSAKSMRGAGMEDVIFAGAATRPPRHFAEVTLTIDNAERRAPEGFNEADQLEITRRITRDAGSSYRCNGKEIRARDAQRLFADAATGANSPALVRQGQIAELINAKPKARRRILEDAAGVAGLHARRHEALMRLNGAETNLTRIVEILEQLEARTATLSREAERATRYRELSRDIRLLDGMLNWRRWREADRERAAAEALVADGQSKAAAASLAASEAQRRRVALEDGAPALREEEAIARALYAKLLMERDQLEAKAQEATAAAERLKRQIAQHRADLSREAAAEADAGEALARAEGALADMAAASDADHAEQAATLREAEAAAAAAAREAEAALDALTAATAMAAAERASLERRAAEEASKAQRLTAEAAEAEARVAALDESIEAAEAAAEAAREDVETARMAEEDAALSVEGAEDARSAAEATRREADAAAAAATGALAAIRSEIAAVAALAAEADPSEDGAALDAVVAEPGFEAALGAAFGETLAAPVAEAGWGWRALPIGEVAAFPSGAAPLSAHVEAPQALARRLAAVALVDAEQGAALQAQLQPGQALVSRAGDLWRWDGYVAPSGAGMSRAAAELERRNRLAAAEARAGDAETQAAATAADLANASAALERARQAENAARDAVRRAASARVEAERAAAAAENAALSAQAKRASLLELAAARFEARETAAATAEEARLSLAALAEAERGPEAEADARQIVAAARDGLADARAAREAFERDLTAQKTRRAALETEAAGWRRRLEASAEQRAQLEDRIAASEDELETAEAAPLAVEERRDAINEDIDAATTRLTAAVDALAAADSALKAAAAAERAAEADLAATREDRARQEARIEAATTRAAEFAAAVEEIAGCKPDAYLEAFSLDPDTMATVKDLERDLGELKRKRERLGAVNLRAEQELEEITAQTEGLARERADLDAAVAKLRQAVNTINKEGRDRLLAAFDEVNKNFTALFSHLFNGGDAKLVLVESDDPLEAGLEIWCQPPQKRLSSLSLLSGGEQTLTAISLIFAVFLVNPAPICVLDEVDAPLDDANVGRFCDLLDEMKRRTKTRFMIITHHAVTMSRMDRLFGVTMVERGVSQLVSVDLAAARELVDADLIGGDAGAAIASG